MSSSITCPPIEHILTPAPSNFEQWKRWLLLIIVVFKLAARPILSGKEILRTPPTKDRFELHPETGEPTDVKYYPHTRDGSALTEAGLAEFRQDVRDFLRISADIFNQNCELFFFIISTLSPESKTSIQNEEPAWTTALTGTNPLLLYQLIVKVHCRVNAAQIQSRTLRFLTLKQTASYAEYLKDFQIGYQHLLSDLSDSDGAHKGYINCDSLGALVFLGGLARSQFQFKINSILDGAHGHLSDLPDLQGKVSAYAADHPDVDPEDSPSSAFFSGNAATRPTKKPSQPPSHGTPPVKGPLCRICNSPFTPRNSLRSGQPFTTCYTCYGASKVPPPNPRPSDLTSAHVAQGLLAAADSTSHRIAMEADYQSQQIARFQLQRQQLTAASAFSELDDDIFANHAFLAAPKFHQRLPTAAAASDLDADCRSEYSSPDENSEYAYNEDSDDDPYEFSTHELAYLQSPECLDGSDYDPSMSYGNFVFPPDA